jgi:hypothetical protein
MQVAATPLTEDTVATWLATRVVDYEGHWPERPERSSLQKEREAFQGHDGDTKDVAQVAEQSRQHD